MNHAIRYALILAAISLLWIAAPSARAWPCSERPHEEHCLTSTPTRTPTRAPSHTPVPDTATPTATATERVVVITATFTPTQEATQTPVIIIVTATPSTVRIAAPNTGSGGYK